MCPVPRWRTPYSTDLICVIRSIYSFINKNKSSKSQKFTLGYHRTSENFVRPKEIYYKCVRYLVLFGLSGRHCRLHPVLPVCIIWISSSLNFWQARYGKCTVTPHPKPHARLKKTRNVVFANRIDVHVYLNIDKGGEIQLQAVTRATCGDAFNARCELTYLSCPLVIRSSKTHVNDNMTAGTLSSTWWHLRHSVCSMPATLFSCVSSCPLTPCMEC